MPPCWHRSFGTAPVCCGSCCSSAPTGASTAASSACRAADPEPADAGSFLATALREAEEEVGLLPSQVEVLAALDPLETMATGFRVYPFLGRRPGRRRVAAPTGRGRAAAHTGRRGSRRGDRAAAAAVQVELLRAVDRGRGHRGGGPRALGHDAATARRPRAAAARRRVGRVGLRLGLPASSW